MVFAHRFFGGAGVSTESGIPDFRSVNGLYHRKYAYAVRMKSSALKACPAAPAAASSSRTACFTASPFRKRCFQQQRRRCGAPARCSLEPPFCLPRRRHGPPVFAPLPRAHQPGRTPMDSLVGLLLLPAHRGGSRGNRCIKWIFACTGAYNMI